jgi:hypothetical protein
LPFLPFGWLFLFFYASHAGIIIEKHDPWSRVHTLPGRRNKHPRHTPDSKKKPPLLRGRFPFSGAGKRKPGNGDWLFFKNSPYSSKNTRLPGTIRAILSYVKAGERYLSPVSGYLFSGCG